MGQLPFILRSSTAFFPLIGSSTMFRATTPLAFAIAATLAFAPLTLAAFALTTSQSASADDAVVTWSVEPSPTTTGVRDHFEYKVDPGTEIRDSFVIKNLGKTSADFLVYATDAINDPESGAFGLLKREEKAVDLGSWITTATAKITLEPGTQAEVPFDVLVPSDATPGDHSAGVIASVVTKGESNGAAVQLEQRVASRVYMRVSGQLASGVVVSGATSGFTAQLNPFAPGNIGVSYNVKNTGNVRIDLAQKIEITGPFGIPLGVYTPKPLAAFIPGQTVRLTADVPSIAAALLAWSNITVTPGEVGGVPGPKSTAPASTAPPTESPNLSAAATPAAPSTGAAGGSAGATNGFEPASSSTFTLAVSWTLLVLVVVAIAVAYLIWRYVSGTRERMYLAIDEAAEAARLEATNAAGTTDRFQP